MQEDNIIKAFPLEDILEFTIQKEAMTQTELNSMNNIIKNAPTIIEADKEGE